MREIKFRGRRTDTGEWIHGDSIKHTDNATDKGVEELIYIGNKIPNTRKVGAMKWIPVEESTVGQYTGLLDCNGKEIYEGDIVRYYDDIEDCLKEGTVEYQSNWASFNIINPDLGDPIPLVKHWSYEIIGNIHDRRKED